MARTRRPLIAGNWKMNGLRADGLALAKAVADGVRQAGWRDREVLVCPPATLVLAVAEAVKGSGVLVGGQNCHTKPSGAHTGEIAAEMLRDCGASHVIVGHSERRADCGETDDVVRAKAEAAWRAGLLPIICIGETQPSARRARPGGDNGTAASTPTTGQVSRTAHAYSRFARRAVDGRRGCALAHRAR
jgi:triosephosphate isomerase